ncbi:hypothetical protein F5148DRAFT_10638 [Russula earlei]|uniref:Uncharacterized protein n=1 Tax=Russula earlei TaxID=71964 RepID=A0ACC0UPP3_9AGAM|nr:hypothetical protein F5148DRAFT_10638 [Russula earlei]
MHCSTSGVRRRAYKEHCRRFLCSSDYPTTFEHPNQPSHLTFSLISTLSTCNAQLHFQLNIRCPVPVSAISLVSISPFSCRVVSRTRSQKGLQYTIRTLEDIRSVTHPAEFWTSYSIKALSLPMLLAFLPGTFTLINMCGSTVNVSHRGIQDFIPHGNCSISHRNFKNFSISGRYYVSDINNNKLFSFLFLKGTTFITINATS